MFLTSGLKFVAQPESRWTPGRWPSFALCSGCGRVHRCPVFRLRLDWRAVHRTDTPFHLPGLRVGQALARMGDVRPPWRPGVARLGDCRAGYRYRLCALLFFLSFTYVELLDKTAYLNHYYWAALVSLLMVFLPLHRSVSVDAWLESRTMWGKAPAGALWLLRAQLAAMYIFAGIAKLNADWLLEAQPLRIWLQDHTGLPMVGPLMGEAWAAYAFSWGGAFLTSPS